MTQTFVGYYNGGYGYYVPYSWGGSWVYAVATSGFPDWWTWSGSSGLHIASWYGYYLYYYGQYYSGEAAQVSFGTYPAMYVVGIVAGNDGWSYDEDEAYLFAVATDIGIEGVAPAQEENPGGFIAVGGSRKHITLNVEPLSELLYYGRGVVDLKITNGANKALLYSSATGGTGVSEVSWAVPDDAEDLEYYIEHGCYVGGISASTSPMDVQVHLRFLDPYYGNPVFDDWVNLTVVQLDHLTVTGATQTNVTGAHNWAAIKNASGNVTVEAILNPTIPDAHVPDVLVWTGGNAVPDHPRQRTVPKATSAETTVTATVGSSSDYANIWILWATVEIKMSGTTPTDAVQFGSSMDGTETLGAVSWTDSLGDTCGAGKFVAVGSITPPGVHNVVVNGWAIKRSRWTHTFTDGRPYMSNWNTDWTDDTSFWYWTNLTPDPNDQIFDTDAPRVAQWIGVVDSAEHYSNFRQWVEWGGAVASDQYAYFHWQGRWKIDGTPEKVTLKELGSGTIALPDAAYYNPP